MILNTKQRLLLVVSVSIAVITLLIGREGIVRFFEGSSSDKLPVTVLRGELIALSVPENHKPLDQIKLFDREIATGATRHYRAPTPADVVAKYYKQILTEDGWILSDERYLVGGERVIKFCKRSMSLTLDMLDEDGKSTYYYLGVVWAKAKSDRAYCPKQINGAALAN